MNKDAVVAIVALVGLVMLGALLQMGYVKTIPPQVIEKKEVVGVIDSVWFTKPGQEHSLQTSYKYYGHLNNGGTISSIKPFHVGDSILSIHYKYKKY